MTERPAVRSSLQLAGPLKPPSAEGSASGNSLIAIGVHSFTCAAAPPALAQRLCPVTLRRRPRPQQQQRPSPAALRKGACACPPYLLCRTAAFWWGSNRRARLQQQ